MNQPKISVIVPVYNIEAYISKCVESLINQTYRDIEIILVDDGSKDASGAICDRYAAQDSRVIVIHKPNGGLSSARNTGIDKAMGKWIMNVDGDDWLEPDMLSALYDKAKASEVDMVFSDFFYDYTEQSVPTRFYDWDNSGSEHDLQGYIASGMTNVAGVLIKKSIYDEHGLRSPEGISCCEDFHLIVRLCYYARKIAKVKRPLYHYTQRPSSILHNLDKKTEREEREIYKEIINFFKDRGVYAKFERCMAWRTLKASQELALSSENFDRFCEYNPDKKRHIFSCPFIGVKMKIIAWSLTHGLRPVATTIVKFRHMIGR